MAKKDHRSPHLRLCQDIGDLIAEYITKYPKILEWDYSYTKKDDNGRVATFSIEVDSEGCSHDCD